MEAKPLFLLLSIVLLLHLPCPADAGFRIGLTHVDSIDNSNIATEELVKRAVDRTKNRMAFIQSKLAISADDVRAPFHWGTNPVVEYYMDLSIGTPSTSIVAMMDTGSDLVWTQCQPCQQCLPQSTIYDPSKSSTFSHAPCESPLCKVFGSNSNCSSGQCNYFFSYGDQSSTSGVLGSETFTLGDSSVNNISFGCGVKNAGFYNGIMGLGPGPLSLPAQLNSGKFSYCLNKASKSSVLLLGSSASLGGSVQSTPFLNDKRWYFIALQGISLGANRLSIPSTVFQYNPSNGEGGTIIDSGTTLTLIPKEAYDILSKEIVSLVNLPAVKMNTSLGLDLCFQVSTWPPPNMPDMTLHFDGADMTVPPENYMIADQQTSAFCSLVLPTSFSMSILGNYLQHNIHILYDLEKGALSFAPAQCDQV